MRVKLVLVPNLKILDNSFDYTAKQKKAKSHRREIFKDRSLVLLVLWSAIA